jgi:hypothetical protein
MLTKTAEKFRKKHTLKEVKSSFNINIVVEEGS